MAEAVNLARMWRDMLELCRLGPDEHVVVLNHSARPSPYATHALLAAEATGASATLLQVADPSKLPPAAIAAIRQSSLLIDLAFSHDSRVFASLKDGLRVLVAVEPPEILARMFPTMDDRRRCIAARHRLGYAKTMQVVSDAGTDITFGLGEFEAKCQYGFPDEKGRWDQWPGAFVYTFPNEGSSNGVVVLDRGDILFPMKSYLQAPVRLTVKDGFITDISGGLDADFIKDVLDSYKDPNVYAISHLGWGLSANGRWNNLGFYDKAGTEGQDGRAFYGNFLFSTGPNSSGGGKRHTPCHIDIPMRNCSVFLDNQAIVLRGEVMPEDQRVAQPALAAE